MARYDFVVDTTPMGKAISSIALMVDRTSTTVVSASQAIEQAEAEAAEKISSNVSRGFFNLVISQLNQKLAGLRSSLQAKDAQLIEEKRMAEYLRSQFFGDFQMIKRRYHKLFTTLDRALKNRVYELDKPLTSMLEAGYRANIKGRLNNLCVPAVLAKESQEASLGLEVSRAKQHSLKLLAAVRDYLAAAFQLQTHIEKLLAAKSDSRQSREIILPSLVLEHDSFVSGIRATVFKFPSEDEHSRTLYHEVAQSVSGLDIESLEWKPADAQARTQVLSEYYRILDSSDLSEREKKEMRRLMDGQSDWFELEGVSI